MTKCEKCGTTWTSAGMTLCPICGEGIPGPAPVRRKTEILAAVGAAPKKNGSPMEAPDPTPPPEDPTLKVTVFPSQKDSLAGEPFPSEPSSPVDASAILSLRPPAVTRGLPAPARPLNGPLILGLLAMVTGVMLPLTTAFESHRIAGILGFCMSGFFVPFAPVAWIAGLSAEKRRREQGLSPERRVVIGRLLGQWGTLVLIVEVTLALILIAGLRLSGSFPASFWAH
jgi:hypothetical protein